MSNLTTRVISATIALAMLSAFIWLGPKGLFLLCFLTSLMAFVEFSKFIKKPMTVTELEFKFIRWGFVGLGCLLFLGAAQYSSHLIITFPLAFVLLATGVSWFVARKENLTDVLPMLNMLFLGFIYCAILPSVSVRICELGVGVFLCHLAAVFGGDIAAYFSGKLFGRKKLHVALSPRKTIEGSLGGLMGSVLLGYGTATWMKLPIAFETALIVFLATGLFGQMGDLFESFLKRYAQVKDSGYIMPGHGGVLDRLDGVLFSAPVFLLLYSLLIR